MTEKESSAKALGVDNTLATFYRKIYNQTMTEIKNGLYNYYTSHKKFFDNSTFIFVTLILGFSLTHYKDVFSDQNLSYYLFSTIVQGFLSLLGFLGALAIFKIQLLENEISQVADSMREPMRLHRGTDTDGYSSIEIMNEAERIIQDHNVDIDISKIRVGHARIKKVFNEKSDIRKSMVDFAMWSFINVSLALLGLLYSKVLIVNGLYFFASIYPIINVCISLVSLLTALLLIRRILGYSFTL